MRRRSKNKRLTGAGWVFLGTLGVVQAQIDPTLFGDHLGPPIPGLPDTGEEFVVMDGAQDLTPPPALTPAGPGAASAAQDGLAWEPELPGEGGASQAGGDIEGAAEKKNGRSWFRLPWGKKGRAEAEARLEQERAKYGPQLGKLRTGASVGGGAVDSGLTPSELNRWKRDPRKAMVEARAGRRLLLLWMTDSLRSSSSKSQAVEVFRHTQFLRMAKDYMVLTKIDFAEPDLASHPYSKYLKEKLNVLGYPALILFDPDSQEIWRYRGYRRGRYPEIISELRYQVKTHALKEQHVRDQLVSKGYRDWTNDRDQLVFAKAVEVSREEKTVTFLDRYGKRYRYPVIRLSNDDRNWLAERFLR